MSLTSNTPYLTVWDAASDMRPGQSSANAGDGLFGYFVLSGHLRTGRLASAYFDNILLCQGSEPVPAASWPSFRMNVTSGSIAGCQAMRLSPAVVHVTGLCSPLSDSIKIVVSTGSKEEMPGIAARGIVADMADEKITFPDTVGEQVSDGCGVVIDPTDANPAVLHFVPGWPTLVDPANVDLLPESSDVGFVYAGLFEIASSHGSFRDGGVLCL